MFLNNHKYWMVNYKYSDDLGDYIQSVKSFLLNLITTNFDEFKIIDISKNNILTEQQQKQYHNRQHAKKIIDIYIAEFTELLVQKIQKKVDEALAKEINSNKNSLLRFNKKIFYSKKRENEKKTIISEINGNLKRSFLKDNILENEIIDFWEQIVNNKTMDILKVFIKYKTKNISLITDNDNASLIDFLPVKISDIDTSKIQYDENKSNFTTLQLKAINDVFLLDLNSGELIISEAYINGRTAGLVLDDYLFFYNAYPVLKESLSSYKIIKLNYFKKNILKDDIKKNFFSEKIDEFKKDMSKDELIVALSMLENNLYSTGDPSNINDKIKEKYFIEGYKVESDYLEKNQIFIPYTRNTPALFGIHNNSNARTDKGKPEKGLKSWINSSSEEQKSGFAKSYTKAKKVTHLLPDIAFYFKEKFFEDYLKSILNEIKKENSKSEMEIISNKIFYINTNPRILDPLSLDSSFDKLQEFDFIVNYNKKDGTQATVVIEAKTKLSKFIIQDQAEKIEKYIGYDDLNIFDKYFLVGFNSDKTVYNAMAYFIKNMHIKGTDGLGFEYPLSSVDKVLYCTASNNLKQLKQNLLMLFNL